MGDTDSVRLAVRETVGVEDTVQLCEEEADGVGFPDVVVVWVVEGEEEMVTLAVGPHVGVCVSVRDEDGVEEEMQDGDGVVV